MKNITYAIDKNTGQVYSRFGNNIAIPILDYEGMTPQNNFKTNYFLESHSVHVMADIWTVLTWTKKIPVNIKNIHRTFWGMKPIREG